jgi:hypothetical protein
MGGAAVSATGPLFRWLGVALVTQQALGGAALTRALAGGPEPASLRLCLQRRVLDAADNPRSRALPPLRGFGDAEPL